MLKQNRPVGVLTEELPYICISAGWHVVVPCPDHCADLFSNSIWVWSYANNRAVRLQDYEVLDEVVYK